MKRGDMMSDGHIIIKVKKTVLMFLALIIALIGTGCEDETSENSPPPLQSAQTAELPVDFSPPDTMKVDYILQIVNNLIMENNNDKKIFVKQDAEKFTVPDIDGNEQILYLFIIEDLETAIFAGKETDCVISAYVRMLFDEPRIKQYMFSYAGAFLAALEPKHYEEMLLSVLPEEAGEEETADETVKTASGEAWSVYYSGDIVKILPENLVNQLEDSEHNE